MIPPITSNFIFNFPLDTLPLLPSRQSEREDPPLINDQKEVDLFEKETTLTSRENKKLESFIKLSSSFFDPLLNPIENFIPGPNAETRKQMVETGLLLGNQEILELFNEAEKLLNKPTLTTKDEIALNEITAKLALNTKELCSHSVVPLAQVIGSLAEDILSISSELNGEGSKTHLYNFNRSFYDTLSYLINFSKEHKSNDSPPSKEKMAVSFFNALLNLCSTGSNAIKFSLSVGIRFGTGSLRIITPLSEALGGAGQGLGLGLTLYEIFTQTRTFNNILNEIEIRQLNTHELQFDELIGMRLEALEEQKEKVYVEASRSALRITTCVLGITMTAITAAGLSTASLGTAVIAITITGIVAYGGYEAYKKRNEIHLYFEEFLQSTLSAKLFLSTKFQELNRKISLILAEFKISKSMSIYEKEYYEVINKHASSLSEAKNQLKVKLMEQLAPDSGASLVDIDHQVNSLQQKLNRLQDQLDKELKKIENKHASQINASFEEIDKTNIKLTKLVHAKIKQKIHFAQKSQKIRDKIFANKLNMEIGKFYIAKDKIDKLLIDPENGPKLHLLFCNKEPIPTRPVTSNDVLAWITSPV